MGLESTRPIMKTRVAATPEPSKASHSCTNGKDTPKTPTPTTTEAAAPEFTPSRPGSASGLRLRACMSTPDTARAAPTSSAAAVRGARLAQMSLDSMVFASGFRKPSTDLSRVNMREPTAKERAQRNASSRHPRMSAMVKREIDGPLPFLPPSWSEEPESARTAAMDSLLGAAR